MSATSHVVSWRLAPGVMRLGGRRLAGGAPFRVVRLGERGEAELRQLLGTTSIPAPGTAVSDLTRRLERYGLLLGPARDAVPVRAEDVTVVVPALSAVDDVARVIAAVPPGVPMVVVDDGSHPPLAPGLSARPELSVLRHDRSRGPAAARNAGAKLARSTWIAFVDADVSLDERALGLLLACADDSVVAVAPRIVSGDGAGAAAAIERWSGALDQGAGPADVGPRGPVSYVPSAVLLVRREAFCAAGGFAEELRVGEDVDLVWRLLDLGRVRYEPGIVCLHKPRSTVWSVLRRRYDYGTSAAALEARHPGELRHVDVSVWSFAPWAVAVGLSPVLGAVAAAVPLVLAPMRLRELGTVPAVQLALRGHLAAWPALGRWLVRPMWPLTALLAVTLPGRRRRIAAAVLLGAAGLVRRSVVIDRMDPATVRASAKVLAASVVDDLAYSAGVWTACLRRRSITPLLPRIRGVAFLRRRVQ